jgi:hypothetical protein
MGESWRLFLIKLFRVTFCLVRKYVLTYSVVSQHVRQVMSAAKWLHTPLIADCLWLLYRLDRSGKAQYFVIPHGVVDWNAKLEGGQ